jgi:uncharacterized membrane protein (UPF0127 family)
MKKIKISCGSSRRHLRQFKIVFVVWTGFFSVACTPGCESPDANKRSDDISSTVEVSKSSPTSDVPASGDGTEVEASERRGCDTDRDCQTYLRCIQRRCQEPPAMTGEVSEHTPEVVIYSDASQGDATEVASFNVEIADTPAERSRGLMHRPDMEDGWGMLFIYPNEASRRFWMKNTLIPLDMLFIRADKTVANIVHSAEPQTRTGRHSDGAVKYVLEITGGEAKDRGIEPGQTVEFVGVESGQRE